MGTSIGGARKRHGLQWRSELRGVLLLAALAGCSHHVRMVVPNTSAGARYTCTPNTACTPATTDVPAELNKSGTSFVILPNECKGHIHQVVVLDADSSKPSVDVTCAPHEEPLKEME